MNASAPISCPDGWWCEFTGTQCLTWRSCPKGFYCQVAAPTVPCPLGFYCPEEGSTPVPCSDPIFCPISGLSAPMEPFAVPEDNGPAAVCPDECNEMGCLVAYNDSELVRFGLCPPHSKSTVSLPIDSETLHTALDLFFTTVEEGTFPTGFFPTTPFSDSGLLLWQCAGLEYCTECNIASSDLSAFPLCHCNVTALISRISWIHLL